MKSLYESILDDTQLKVSGAKKNVSKGIKTEIKNFIKENYQGTVKISKDVDENGLYVVDSINTKGVSLKNKNINSLTGGLPFRFGDIWGDFSIINSNIMTLEGAPKLVHGEFWCVNSNILTLEGGPETVEGFVNINGCQNLKSIVGSPKKVGADFDVIRCNKLKTLEGAPETVSGYMKVKDCDGLTHLNTNTKTVGICFVIEGCPNLISLNGSPECILGDFRVINCYKLKNLQGSPDKVGRYICNGCTGITSLKGITQKSSAPARNIDVFCNGTSITSLEGLPNKMEELSCCDCTNLTSLKGCPTEVHIIDCNGCINLENIDDIPSKMHYLNINHTKVDVEHAKEICKFTGGVE